MGQKDVLGKARRIKLGKRTNEKKLVYSFVLNPDKVRSHPRNSDLELHLYICRDLPSRVIFSLRFFPLLSKCW